MIETYEEFKERHKNSEYSGVKCFLCNKPAEYKCGDDRFYFPGCEDHAEMKERYDDYAARIESRRKARETWRNLPWVKDALDTLEKELIEGTSDMEPKGLMSVLNDGGSDD